MNQVSGGAAGKQINAVHQPLAEITVARAGDRSPDGVAWALRKRPLPPGRFPTRWFRWRRPNKIALHEVVRRTGPIQKDAVLAVAGNQVARATDSAADGVPRRLDVDPAKLVGQSGLPSDVRADVIALNRVAGGRGVKDLDAIVRIAGNDVARARGCPANRV